MKTTDRDVVVIYHKNCWDGLGAAWAAWRNFGDTAEYVPFAYGMPIEDLIDVTGKSVYIVDFSFSRDVLLNMKDKTKELVVLDHHASAQKDLEGLDFCVFDMGRSGALMTWNYFFPNAEVPTIIELISDRDLWKFNHASSKPFHACLTLEPFDIGVLEDMHIKNAYSPSWTQLMVRGQTVIDFSAKLVDTAAKGAVVIEMLGKRVLVCQSIPNLASELGEALALKSPDGIGCVFTIYGKDNKVSLSFRGTGEADVIPLAKFFGGGGHRKAGGGATDITTFHDFMTSRRLV